MNLVLDFGNTRLKWAVFEHNSMIFFKSTNIFSSSFFEQLLDKYSDIHNVCVSSNSVIPEFISIMCCKKKINYLVLSVSINLPIEIHYKSLKTLGVDRLGLVLGAYKLYKENLLIIDFGTCITYDLLLDNHYYGGQISPGFNMRLSSLHHYTEKLPKLDFEWVDQHIGNTTKSSMLLGVRDSVLFEVENVIDKYRLRYPNIMIVITGGDIKFVKNKLKNINFIHPYLLMEGLNHIIAFNE